MEEMLVKPRVRVVVIEVATAIVAATEIGIEATTIATIRRKNVEEKMKRKREEIGIERRNVVDGMRMTAETVTPRSVVVNATMVMVTGMSDPLRSPERMTEIGEAIVTATGIGIEVRV